ncbi:MAG TPA: hypothetical protein VF800_02690 [Telluria sp.]|jgi:hypothetical protein
MNLPTFAHRGYIAVGHPHVLPSGKFNGAYSIHEETPFGRMVYRTDGPLEFGTVELAIENMNSSAKALIDTKVDER